MQVCMFSSPLQSIECLVVFERKFSYGFIHSLAKFVWWKCLCQADLTFCPKDNQYKGVCPASNRRANSALCSPPPSQTLEITDDDHDEGDWEPFAPEVKGSLHTTEDRVKVKIEKTDSRMN
eukprot:Pompholyxophrys_punicea_v1_NODE_131_length_3293_cov_4.448734.p2 type:complete len:121 gc:universal NODE_131_length_3293_cov_4.448734:2239-2601(+)